MVRTTDSPWNKNQQNPHRLKFLRCMYAIAVVPKGRARSTFWYRGRFLTTKTRRRQVLAEFQVKPGAFVSLWLNRLRAYPSRARG